MGEDEGGRRGELWCCVVGRAAAHHFGAVPSEGMKKLQRRLLSVASIRRPAPLQKMKRDTRGKLSANSLQRRTRMAARAADPRFRRSTRADPLLPADDHLAVEESRSTVIGSRLCAHRLAPLPGQRHTSLMSASGSMDVNPFPVAWSQIFTILVSADTTRLMRRTRGHKQSRTRVRRCLRMNARLIDVECEGSADGKADHSTVAQKMRPTAGRRSHAIPARLSPPKPVWNFTSTIGQSYMWSFSSSGRDDRRS